MYDSDGGTLLSWERAIVFHEDEEIVAVAVEKSYLGDENIVIAIGKQNLFLHEEFCLKGIYIFYYKTSVCSFT